MLERAHIAEDEAIQFPRGTTTATLNAAPSIISYLYKNPLSLSPWKKVEAEMESCNPPRMKS